MLQSLLYVLLIPPSALLLPLAIGLLWRRALGWLALALLVVLGMPVTSATLNRLIAIPPGLQAGTPPQAIVVLSAEERVGAPGGVIEGFDLGPLTTERLRAGVRLQHKTGLPVLVTGGVVAPDTPPIATTMAQVMQTEFATPARWVEDRSRTTWENATLSAALLRADGIGSIYLVTTSWHMPRAVLAFERAGLQVTPAPARIPQPLGSRPQDYLPQAAGWQASYYALHELIGWVWYRVRG